MCWFSWIASACPGRGRIHSRAVPLHSLRFTLPINSCVIRPSHILPFLPPPHPRITQHSQTSNLRPPYIISLQLSPLVKRFPSTDHTHLATCLSLPKNTLFRALHNFLLNAPICSLTFSFLFLKCTIGVGKLGPGHDRGSGTSCRLQRRDSLRA